MSFSAGVAQVDITPPKGFRMAGYFSERFNTGTKDPLLAKAVVFGQDDAKAALVFCDLIGLPPHVTSQARALAAHKVDMSSDHISIAATHSHTGPLYYGALWKYFNDTRDPDPVDYGQFLIEKIVESVQLANAALRPAKLEAGSATQDPPLSFNRRFHMKDGSVRFNPGQQNPDIVRAAGPIDPEVGVVKIGDVATLAVFALHLDTTGGTEYSADYPYWLQKELGKTVLFGAGTCGDVNHIDVSIKGRRSAQEIGTMLGKTVKEAKLSPLAPLLGAKCATVELALQSCTPEQVEQASKDMARIGSKDLPFLKQVEVCRIMDLQLRQAPKVALDVHVFRLAPDTAIVTLPGEVFVEHGLAVKKASPFKHTWVIELANDCPAYIPTRKAFEEGSYEIVNSRVQPGGGEALVETAVQLLKDLKP